MKAEDVPAEIVEKAYRARADYMRGEPIGDLEWQAVWSTIEADGMRHALAAVLPEVRAQALAPRWLSEHDREVAARALREAAERILPYSDIGLANGAPRADVSAWLMDRAARLATTTEGTTT